MTFPQLEAFDGSKMSSSPKTPTSPPPTYSEKAPMVGSMSIEKLTSGNSHPTTADIGEPSSSQSPRNSVSDGYLKPSRLLRRDDVKELPIDERTCLLQNYGIFSGSGVEGLGNNGPTINSVKVFDYSVEHLDDGHPHLKDEIQEITERETDKQSEVSLESLAEPDSFLELWHNPRPENNSLIYLRVMDFSNVDMAAQKFLPNAEKMIQREMESNVYKMLYETNKKPIATKDLEFVDDLGSTSDPNSRKGKGLSKPTGSFEDRDYSEITIENDNADRGLVKDAKDIAEKEMKQFSKILTPENLPTLKSSTPVFFNSSEEGRTLVLGVSLPYFSLGRPIRGEMPESFSLPEYMSLGRDKNKRESEDDLIPMPPETNATEARVHKALLMVINNEIIAIFRSKEDKQSERPPPLFQYQERHGAYRALVTIISNILKCPQKKVFNFFKDKLCKQQYEVTCRMNTHRSTSTDGIGIISNLQKLDTDISALNIVVKSQIEILKELRQIYENTFYQENIYDRNSVKIPVLWEMKEQIEPALPTIDKIIGERKLFYENLDDLVKGVRKLQKSFCKFIEVEIAMNTTDGVQSAIQVIGNERIPTQTTTIVQAIEDQTQYTERVQTNLTKERTEKSHHQLQQQTKAIVLQNDIISKQARVMTALMFISMVFLPLGFFASYLGMNEGWVHRAKSEHTIFWAIAAPFTLVIGIVTCWFDHVFEDWPQRWKSLTRKKPPPIDSERAEPRFPTCNCSCNCCNGTARNIQYIDLSPAENIPIGITS